LSTKKEAITSKQGISTADKTYHIQRFLTNDPENDTTAYELILHRDLHSERDEHKINTEQASLRDARIQNYLSDSTSHAAVVLGFYLERSDRRVRNIVSRLDEAEKGLLRSNSNPGRNQNRGNYKTK
jgi:hypothetical protein